MEENKSTETATLTAGKSVAISFATYFSNRMLAMSDVARSVGDTESALAFDCIFAAVGGMPYIISRGLELEFMRRVGQLCVELVAEADNGDLTQEETERFLKIFSDLGDKSVADESDDKVIH